MKKCRLENQNSLDRKPESETERGNASTEDNQIIKSESDSVVLISDDDFAEERPESLVETIESLPSLPVPDSEVASEPTDFAEHIKKMQQTIEELIQDNIVKTQSRI